MRETVRAGKAECTGCGACASICPKGAIAMRPDEEGFLYPAVDAALCISCDLCEKRCPAGKEKPAHKPLTLGAQHRDAQVRARSSSGGVFTALARGTLRQGGVVFGAVFGEGLRVEHIGAMEESELSGMLGSKYVQSDSAEAIGHAAQLLERGIPVLFSGTPCQVDGLLARVPPKHREKLLTVDFTCHGVPSPGVFASYLHELEESTGKRVARYAFRDKRCGWKNFSAVATFEDGTEHVGTQTDEPYLYGFLQNLYLRPSCVECRGLRGAHHAADLTISDLWGAQQVCPERDDDTGLSLVQANTQAGRRALEAASAELVTFPVKTDALLRFNPSLEQPARAHEKREAFFRLYRKHGFRSGEVMKLLSGPGMLQKAARRIAHLPKGLARRVRALLGR
ncbi:MAG: Coenzyme F420 hydrogenase/dehydrogenase, beta subunit C-terminal domain [Clostridiales bacterium]|nr:Coenzyme F420 hydrogenase/dehydrogenase, beta subunit C-terminal domain [Clostridiales bacterium]